MKAVSFFRRRLSLHVSAAIGLFFGLQTAIAIAVSAEQITFDQIQAMLAQADSVRADIFSANNYKLAAKYWDRARESLSQKRSPARTQKYLEETKKYLQKALETTGLMNTACGDLVSAYDNAMLSRASQLAPQAYELALNSLATVVEKLEKGDLDRARKLAEEAQQLFRRAELEAIKADILAPARQLLAEAEAANCPQLTPSTYAQAQSALQQVDAFLTQNRYRREDAQQMVTEASSLLKHAIYLAKLISQAGVEASDWEKIVLQFEDYISRISNELHLQPRFDREMTLNVAAIQAAIRSLQEDRLHLQQELSDRDFQIGKLEAEVQKLKGETGRYMAELEAKRLELEKQKHFAAKIARISALFADQEGSVLHSSSGGTDLIVIRLVGLKFPSGSFEIRPEDFTLLTKVQQAIREFPDRKIIVEGHTDSKGKEEDNLELSRKRAQAVKDYLQQNLNLPEERISAVGFGESQPIASNDTAAGRAQNRRIEIVLKL